MERYEAWMKEWNTYKFNWLDSEERIDRFVLRAIPPRRQYSTVLHFDLTLHIARVTGCSTRISQRKKCIEVPDGYLHIPSIHFHEPRANSKYPWSVNYGMTVGSMTATTDKVDVLDEFGIVTFRLMDFRRVSVLKVVRAMKESGFGVLHGEIGSEEYSVGEPCNNIHSKIPCIGDPIWMYV